MIELAYVFDRQGVVIRWHEPPGCSTGSIPDSRSLWDVLWDHREIVGGVCHIHPWYGEAWPSSTDLTTFAAVEAGLGKRLLWPIVTFTEVKYYVFDSPNTRYIDVIALEPKHWLDNVEQLRRKSRNGE